MRNFCFFWVILITCSRIATAQTISPSLLNTQWSANWVAVPAINPTGYGVYLFRKTISLEATPASFIVHVSADNRYKLFINEKLVSLGPARGDLYYWNYETVDIATWLLPGKNTIAAIVWNEGENRPEGQISNRSAFLVQGNTAKEKMINTDTSWRCWKDNAYAPLKGIGYNAYYVAGPGELIDMHVTPAKWKQNDFDDKGWNNAARLSRPNPKGVGDISGWMLVPSALPQMELSSQRFAAVRRSEGVSVPQTFPVMKSPFVIPADTVATILLDQSFLTNAYPVFNFSKGNNAAITFIYAESLFNEIPNGPGKIFRKGNRNEVEGKFIAGRKDSIISGGGDKQEFITLNYRTFRYIQIQIRTKAEPLIIDDIYSLFTGYPFKLTASFDAKNEIVNKIFEIGWRTARACAVETYMDCPYYEQLQYIGDARIQALVSFYNSGDDKLVRNAISQMDHSRIAEGITLSRHPSFSPQQIPTFSLWYIGMVYDYWMYRGDTDFIKDKLQGIRGILWFFSKYEATDGSLKNVPYWNFTDWLDKDTAWRGGVAPQGPDGSSSILDMQLLWAYQLAATLESQLGSAALASAYKEKANRLTKTIQRSYWDLQKKLFADTRKKDLFSQHANLLAILTGLKRGVEAKSLAEKILADTSLSPASIYFKYYLHQAFVKVDLGNDYLEWLHIWKQNIDMGLTTWAEISDIDNARSDCHAWGSSPNIEFLRTVAGIDSDSPGFKKVKIQPHLGDLENVKAKMPHPNGSISVNYQLISGKWKIEIELPAKIPGRLIWKGKNYLLSPGKNVLNL